MKVAILGLGVMGHGMAGQLLAHGHEVAVYNRTPERAGDLIQRGAKLANTPKLAAAGATTVITMVAHDQALYDLAVGPHGLLAALGKGAILLQMSTVSLEATTWLAMEAGNRGASFIDGPVLGSLNEAKEGKLWVLAGADPETLDRVKPVLNSISQAVYHVGAIGRGTQMKLCSNLVGAGLVAALAEGMALLDAVGLDASQYMQIVQETNLPTRLWIGKATQMANRDFSPRFSLDNMAKDVRLALTMATQHGLDLRQGEASHASLRRGAVVAGGDRDMAAIFEAARQRTT